MSRFRFKDAPVEHIQDRRTRRALEHLNGELRRFVEHLGAAFFTDPVRGRAELVSPLVVVDVGHDPRQVSTYGRPGTLARFGNRTFQKQGLATEDTDWVEFIRAQPGEVTVAFFNQTDTPTAPSGPAIWWKPTGSGNMVLYINQQKSGTWDWRYYGATGS